MKFSFDGCTNCIILSTCCCQFCHTGTVCCCCGTAHYCCVPVLLFINLRVFSWKLYNCLTGLWYIFNILFCVCWQHLFEQHACPRHERHTIDEHVHIFTHSVVSKHTEHDILTTSTGFSCFFLFFFCICSKQELKLLVLHICMWVFLQVQLFCNWTTVFLARTVVVFWFVVCGILIAYCTVNYLFISLTLAIDDGQWWSMEGGWYELCLWFSVLSTIHLYPLATLSIDDDDDEWWWNEQMNV